MHDMNDENYDDDNDRQKAMDMLKKNGFKYELESNDEVGGWDLEVYDEYKGRFLLGYIEVEVSNHLRLSGVDWDHSFLARKVDKPDTENVVYFKMSYLYSEKDCICCKLDDIKYFKKINRGFSINTQNNSFYRTDVNDCRVPVGINNVVYYLNKFFDLIGGNA